MGEDGVSYVFKWESPVQLPQFHFPQVTTEEVSIAAEDLAPLSQLSSGMRVSQLLALSRHSPWTVFATQAPVPFLLDKNEREGLSLLPFTIPACFEEGLLHPLCPVAVLRYYLLSTEAAPWEYLFVWPLFLS
ncbi:hypothetical protein Pcinc_004963 [Petrolisthes cinctipes]|uniref:Uncharacterized protein n=1 Tax=Petrolisthes cinctipes TaxID=88211 RepID=A0AAE1KZU8_PETCI|nr:hypothetical protein Pcinc_004963 [Petrolisthes cinctipes]